MTDRGAPISAFAIPGSMPELLWWLAIQRVYAKSIGASFAKPQNDTKPKRRKPEVPCCPQCGWALSLGWMHDDCAQVEQAGGSLPESPKAPSPPEAVSSAVEGFQPKPVRSASAGRPATFGPKPFPLFASGGSDGTP
jgi:hypothetical protein